MAATGYPIEPASRGNMTLDLAKRFVFLLPLLIGFSIFLHAIQNSACGSGPLAYSKGQAEALATIALANLPPEARHTLTLIKQGGPFPYPKDGVIFGNREARLPARRRGYYREYTVKTPGSRDRGARRIIAGLGGEFYYTEDHYNTFKLIKE